MAAGFGDGAVVYPAIRWAKPKEKAHLTKGFRSPDMYEPLMRLVEKPTGTVVLFDDVMTSGSQMIAAARLLAKAGFPPTRAVVMALATKEQPDQHFLRERRGTLDLSRPTFDAEF